MKIFRERLEEKERQLQTISRDREELKCKLSQLQSLVEGWVNNTKDQNFSSENDVNGHGKLGSI